MPGTFSVVIGGSADPPAQPIDLPDEMKYDSHNRLTEYIVTDDRKIRLHYDPVGRVFRKEIYSWVSEAWDLTKAIHYYYKGGSLVQEYEVTVESETTAVADIEWDYLRGAGENVIRRRETDGETVTDKLHINAPIGTIMQEADPDVSAGVGTTNGYVTNAEGEPFWVDNLEPTTENHVQYHGGFLEDKEFHTSVANQERGYFYRMGVRHYSPMLGRFLQKDPLTLSRPPSKRTPLTANPYTYALNQPLHLSDISGYVAGGEIMPEPSPGCQGGCGGAGLDRNNWRESPFRGTGNRGSGLVGKDGPECAVDWPEDCYADDNSPDCIKQCCVKEGDPEWMGCCYYTIHSTAYVGPPGTGPPGSCGVKEEGDCECACCRGGGGGENAPVMLGGGFGGGSSGGSDFFGPPNIGPWGDGGWPWEILPMPFEPVGLMGGKKSNKPRGMGAGFTKLVPPKIPKGGIGAALIGVAVGMELDILCKGVVARFEKDTKDCDHMAYCYCQACSSYNKCWYYGSRAAAWILVGVFFFAFGWLPLVGTVLGVGVVLVCATAAYYNFMKCMAGDQSIYDYLFYPGGNRT